MAVFKMIVLMLLTQSLLHFTVLNKNIGLQVCDLYD